MEFKSNAKSRGKKAKSKHLEKTTKSGFFFGSSSLRLPFPKNARVWFRATTNTKNATAAGVGTLSSLSLNRFNSGFVYYTQLAALYNRYRVIQAKWQQTFTTNAGDQNICAHAPINGSNSDTTTLALIEYPRAKYGAVVAYQPLTMTGQIMLHELAGVSKQEYHDADRFQAGFGSNPSETQNLYFIWDNNFATADTISCLTVLDLEIELMDPLMNL